MSTMPPPIHNPSERTLKMLTAACNRLTIILFVALAMGAIVFAELQLDRVRQGQYLQQLSIRSQRELDKKLSEMTPEQRSYYNQLQSGK